VGIVVIKMVKIGIDSKKYFQAILVSFLVIQAISFILYQYADIPLLKIGWLLILSLIIVAISTLFTLGVSINQLDTKSIIFMGVVLLVVIALIFALPKIIPEIFSLYNPSGLEYSNVIRQNLNSILSFG